MIRKTFLKTCFGIILLFSFSFLAELDEYNGVGEDFKSGPSSTRGDGGGLGQYGYPNDPMIDRAKGLLLKGKAKSAVTNYGDFINWYVDPTGLWGEYSYLPDLAMIAGVRGHRYSSEFSWEEIDMASLCSEFSQSSWCAQYQNDINIWWEAHGDNSNPPVLMIMGLNSNLKRWPPELIQGLVNQNFLITKNLKNKP